jgi:transposase
MIPATVRIFVYTEPVDMRRGFDGLALIAREALAQDPRSGAVFIFANRRADRLKALWWDRNGYCLLYKRAHRAVFELPSVSDENSVSVRIDGKALAQLLAGAPKVKRQRAKLRVVR